MKKIITTVVASFLFVVPQAGFAQSATSAEINQLLQEDLSVLIALNGRTAVEQYLQELIFILQERINDFDGDYNNRSSNGEPEVDTDDADDVDEDSAELNGSVDMNDFNNGIVFFAYGEDEDEVEDVEDEDEYDDIDEQGDDLQVIRMDRDLDGDEDYSRDIRNLDEDTDYYFTICVEYEDEDDDERIDCGSVEEFTTDDENGNSNNDDEPEVDTDDADDVEEDTAELNGSVDMNDFNNGIVFFLWGQDEGDVEDATDEDEYADIDEDGDNLQKQRVDTDLDNDEDYSLDIRNLEEDEDYFFTICVEYEDEDDDETLECGSIEEFTTDGNGNSNNDDEPDVDTDEADDIEDDSAELNGSVDMNDFNNGIVFFAYGEDEDQVEDVADEDEFDDIDEDGDDLQVVRVDSDLDGDEDYSRTVSNLDDDTEHFFTICVEYEDEDDDQTIDCGSVEEFRTDD